MDEDGKREGLQMSTSFPFGAVKVFWNEIVVITVELCNYTEKH